MKEKYLYPKQKNYTFSLLSDDGSKLLIDGKVVIDNDGIHPPVEKKGTIKLRRGFHTIEVQYFQGPRYQVALVLSLVENGKRIPFDIRNFSPAMVEENSCETKITLGSGILFDFNSYQLKPESIKTLDTVYNFLSKIASEKIVVEGYTDNVGSKSYNLKLSRERAQAVANYLIAKGVPPEKLKIVGYGEEKPLFPNDTEEHRAKNRRVEIKVYKRCPED
jgi:outer membrane protein OmpA-like peptidoglycan-associated protein